jgi:hypothetical protein
MAEADWRMGLVGASSVFFFFLRKGGYQPGMVVMQYILNIFYFNIIDIRSPLEYRSIECIAAYNCLALHQTARNYTARVHVIQ